MKFPYKMIFLFLLSTQLHAREVILLENLATAKEAEMVINILQKKFNIPRKLITLKNKKSCDKTSEAIMQLCLKADGEMEIVKMNKYVVEETLGVFSELEVM